MLSLSADECTLTFLPKRARQSPPYDPARFDCWPNALGTLAISSGIHSWVLDVGQSAAYKVSPFLPVIVSTVLFCLSHFLHLLHSLFHVHVLNKKIIHLDFFFWPLRTQTPGGYGESTGNFFLIQYVKVLTCISLISFYHLN